jgi:hypothetical protein
MVSTAETGVQTMNEQSENKVTKTDTIVQEMTDQELESVIGAGQAGEVLGSVIGAAATAGSSGGANIGAAIGGKVEDTVDSVCSTIVGAIRGGPSGGGNPL